MITCKICGEKFQTIAGMHLKKHGITLEEYRLAFPGAPTTSEALRDRMGLYRIGETHTKASRELMSKKVKQYYRENPKGPVSEETREKLRKARRGRIISDETKLKCSESMKKYHREKKRKHK